MSIVKSVADHFRSAPKNEGVDRYGILSPLLATGDYITTTADLYNIFKGSPYADLLNGKVKPANKHVEKAVEAYRDYVKGLPNHEQGIEKTHPFSTILLGLESISGNITQIEDNFQALFGNLASDKPETTMRSSSLIVIGYLERADSFATWLSNLVEHMTASDGDMIPPFRTKEMLNKAAESSEFVSFNLHKWNYKSGSLLSEVKEMQAKGSDLSIQASNGAWIDEYAHDSQFSPMEKDLITASLRSPIMMAITRGHVKAQEKIDLLTGRKDWLTSKIVLETSKMRGMSESSPEYKQIKKATERYANIVSKYEQKIERIRA